MSSGDVSATVALLDSLRTKRDAQTVPKAWAAWMGEHDWTWFVNLTFRDAVHPEQADKRYRRWLRWLNREVFGAKNEKRGASVVFVRGLEWQKRDVLHFHALMILPAKFNVPAWRMEAMRQWELIGGGFARIFECDDRAAVREYVAKYASKGGEVDVGGPWDKVRAHHGFALA